MKKWILSLKVMALCLAVMITPGCGQQAELPSIPGVQGPIFNVVEGKVVMTVKLLNMQVDAGFKAPIPKTKNSEIELAPNMIDGGMMLQVYMDVEDLKTINVGIGDGNYLPDGRPIPGVPGGKLEDSLRIDTELRDISFFYHPKLFGLWIPFGFSTAQASAYYNVKINGKRVGFIGLVGNDEERDLPAGGIILLNLDSLKDKQLNKLIDLSKKNPHLVF